MERIADVIEYVARRYADIYPRYQQALKGVLDEVNPPPQKDGVRHWG
jgi:hypothetical protein